jgi:hypothetical protein
MWTADFLGNGLEGGRPRPPRLGKRLAGIRHGGQAARPPRGGVNHSSLMLAISSWKDSARPLAIMRRTWAMVSAG